MQHELAAGMVETADMWGRLALVARGVKPDILPKPPEIRHPGRRHAEPPTRRVTTDAGEIRQFFSRR